MGATFQDYLNMSVLTEYRINFRSRGLTNISQFRYRKISFYIKKPHDNSFRKIYKLKFVNKWKEDKIEGESMRVRACVEVCT